MSKPDPARLKQIVADALELSAELREDFILSACESDAELLREVRSILAAQAAASAKGFLADLPPTERLDPEASSIPEAVSGKMIAERYKLLEPIGEGGMGLVWMAEQRQPMRRFVAIKFIKAGMDSRAVIARFEAERQALALMDHSNIAKVFDGGATEQGHPWFAMELVRGLPLTQYCDQCRMTVRDRLELFMQICSAVQHAHQKGIIHRDLKPGNILVTEHDGHPVPKVIDFGLAKALGGSSLLTEHSLYTSFGMAPGTLLYMAPEQVAINAIDVDTRADIYALGVILYELLTGATPVERGRLHEAAWDEIRRVIREEEAPRPSLRISTSAALPSLAATRAVEPAKLSSLIRGDLDWIILKALDKDRNRRYETANGFAVDIQRHLSDEAVIACPPTWRYRARKFVKKHKGPVIAAAAVSAALLLGVLGTAAMSLEAGRQASLASQSATREAARADAEAKARDAAELESYVANINAAQAAMSQMNYPEARLRLDACLKSKRGWEWKFLHRSACSIRYVIPDECDGAIPSPDGRYVLSWFEETAKARLWDGITGRSLGKPLDFKTEDFLWVGHSISPIFSADSASVFLAMSNTGFLWDLHAGLQNRKVIKDSEIIHSAVFSPDSRSLLTSSGKNARLWNVRTGEPVGDVIEHTEQIRAANFSPDGQLIVTACKDATAQLWDSHTGASVGPPMQHGGDLFEAVFSPDGRFILTLGNGAAIFWSTETSKKVSDSISLGRPYANSGQVHDFMSGLPYKPATFSPDGQTILYRAGLGAHLLRTPTGSEVGFLPVVGNMLSWAQFSPDGSLAATISGTGWLSLFDTQTATAVREWKASGAMGTFAGFSPDGQRIITTCQQGPVCVFDRSGRLLGSGLNPMGDDYRSPVFIPGSDSVLLISGKSKIGEFVSKRAVVVDLKDFDSPKNDDEMSVTFAVEALRKGPALAAETIAEFSADGSIRMLRDGKLITSLIGHDPGVRTAIFSSDGTRLITAGDDRTVRFWDTETWRELALFRTQAPITQLRMTADRSRLIINFDEEVIEVWDIRDVPGRQKDRDACFAERQPAREYVNKLLNTAIKREMEEDEVEESEKKEEQEKKLRQTIGDDKEITPLRKLVALELLELELARRSRESERVEKEQAATPATSEATEP